MKVEIWVNDHITKMHLNIIGVRREDFDDYRCVAKNSLGATDGKIRIHGSLEILQYIPHIFPILRNATERCV